MGACGIQFPRGDMFGFTALGESPGFRIQVLSIVTRQSLAACFDSALVFTFNGAALGLPAFFALLAETSFL